MNNKKFIFCRGLFSKLNSSNLKSLKYVCIYERNTLILEEFIDVVFNVYNGKTFQHIRVVPEMVGFRFVDFVLTKKMTGSIHNKDTKKEKGSKKK